jgi:predicted fused transcriptional regulator/phosphomethylpyrimidine kinase/predicted transcriptional regulator
MRQLVAKKLRSEGLSQSRISAMLGVTQASVSMYLSSKPERAYAELATLSIEREAADRNATLLAEDIKRSAVYGVETLGALWRSMLGKGMVCDAHRKLYPALSQCDVCIKEYGERGGDKTGAIAHVSEAVRLLESSKAFASVMPEVSVNLAYATSTSGSTEDVVAVPGRIVKVKGHAKATLAPEFGASRHIARVLLLVMNRRPEVRASLNLRYDAKVRMVIKRLGLKVLELGEYQHAGSDDRTIAALVSKLASVRQDFDAVIDPGGKGIEPNLYLFGRSATEVASLALRIAKLYSAE